MKQPSSLKKLIYSITFIIMFGSLLLLVNSFFSQKNTPDDIFMDHFMFTLDILIIIFFMFCEFVIGDSFVYFFCKKKSSLLQTVLTIISICSAICCIVSFFIVHFSTNIYASELLISCFSIILIISKIVTLFFK